MTPAYVIRHEIKYLIINFEAKIKQSLMILT